MNRPLFNILITVLTVMATVCRMGQAATWPYDPIYKPISQQEVARIFRDPTVTFKTRRAALARAGVSGLLETVVIECSKQLKQHPQDRALRSFYCYALFIAHDPADYKPQDKNEWLRQQNNLFRGAGLDAEYLVKGSGANVSFCWQTLAYLNLMGIAGGIPKGIKRAEKAVQLAPNDPFAHRLLASAYLESGPTQNLVKALAHARRAAVLQPTAQKPYYYQARAYFLQKNYKAAYSALQKSYALRPPEFRDPQFLQLYESWAKAQAG